MKKILTSTFLATCCISSAFAEPPAPTPIVATSATPPAGAQGNAPAATTPSTAGATTPSAVPDVPPQARRPIRRIRRPVRQQQETKEDDTPDPSAQSIQDALKKYQGQDGKNNTASSASPSGDNKSFIPMATFPDSDAPNEDDEGTVEPEIPQDISQCNGYVMHVKYMNGDKVVDQNDSCLSKGSHEAMHVAKNFVRTGLNEKKYGWSFSVIPGNAGFYNDKSVTILGYYALPVDVVSGDQKNEDALLSVPLIQKINTDSKSWYELLPIDTGSNYHVMPLTVRVSFAEAKSK